MRYAARFACRLVHRMAVPVLMLGAVLVHGVEARQALPDHPFFTGPVHEAEPPPFDVEHLTLSLTPRVETGGLMGAARYRLFPLTDSLRTLRLFAAGLSVDSVRLSCADSLRFALPVETGQADTLMLRLDTLLTGRRPIEVAIYYRATPANGLYFGPPDGAPAQVWTADTRYELRDWMPVLDAPGDRLTATLAVTVPPSLSVFASGRPTGVDTLSDGRLTHGFAVDRPVPMRSLGLAAGAYVVRSEQVLLDDGTTVPVRYAVFPGGEERVAHTFARVPAMIRYFSERLGYPFPWPALTLVEGTAVPAEAATRLGLVVLDSDLLVDEHAARDENPDAVLARAVAGQWFGSLVAAGSETDHWLDDALPAYLALRFLAHEEGTDGGLRLARAADRYFAEARDYRRPLVWDQWEDPHALADAHSRDKGAWVLHMLHDDLGDGVFWQALNRLLRATDFTAIDTDDLQRAVEAEAGRSFQAFFDQWVYAAGHPRLQVEWSYDTRREELSVVVRQAQEGYLVPAAFTAPLTLVAHTLAGADSFAVRLDVREQLFTVPLAMRPRFVLLDGAGSLLAEVAMEQPVTARVARLRGAPRAVDRWRAARALARQPDAPDLLLGLQSALRREPDPAVRSAIVAAIGALPPAPGPERTLRGALDDPASAVREAALTALAAYEGSTAVAARALEAANRDPSYRVQAAAVRTLVAVGAAGAADVVRSALVTPSHREVIRRAAFALLPRLNLPPPESRSLALSYTAADQPPPIRSAAVPFLQALAPKDRRIHSRLMQLLDDPDRRVRLAALRALADAGRSGDLPRLEARLPDTRNRLLRLALEAAIARLRAMPR